MLLFVLGVKVLLEIWVCLTADLDVANMEGVDYLLDHFRLAAWCSSQSEYTMVRVVLHHVSHNLRIGVIACTSMCLVCVNYISNE